MAELGRPSIFSEELTALICTRIAKGESLRSICRDDNMPDLSTIIAWRNAKPIFSKQYELARADQADTLADEIQDIADDGSNDFMERKRKDGSTELVVNAEHIQRSRLRVDTRKWIASKLKPKSYGDKQTVEHQGTLTLESILADSVQPKE